MAELMNTINNNVNHYTKNRSPYDTIEYFNQSTLTSNIDISNKVEIYKSTRVVIDKYENTRDKDKMSIEYIK